MMTIIFYFFNNNNDDGVNDDNKVVEWVVRHGSVSGSGDNSKEELKQQPTE